jgi:DNA-binding transcriptional regulator YdaS (Cro superfamily)
MAAMYPKARRVAPNFPLATAAECHKFLGMTRHTRTSAAKPQVTGTAHGVLSPATGAAVGTFTNRVLSKPAILEATRIVGLTDSDVARLLDVAPPSVTDWVKGRRKIPPARHIALRMLVTTLAEQVDHAPDGPRARRARLLRNSARAWAALADDEIPLPSDDVRQAAEALYRQMITRLEAPVT